MSGARSVALVARHAALLDEACGVRFVREAVEGTLGAADFARYLLVEEAFVLTAARVLGRVVWESDAWEAVLPHARSLTNLVTEQRDYFAGLRGRWPVPAGSDEPTLRRAAVLSDVVLAQVGSGGRAAAVAGMFAAETMYARWCASAAEIPARRTPDLQEWIDLHTAPAFLAQVDALRADIDALDPSEVGDTELDRWFSGVLRAEIAFHDAVYY
ncbi:TenA family protein [Pseudonocardia xinjiangensis]|uniref:TenA family protein n=1 Tax=Pseudonocardia xinjiangensis TaxID=75289 RepID=UPI003D93B1E3